MSTWLAKMSSPEMLTEERGGGETSRSILRPAAIVTAALFTFHAVTVVFKYF